MSKEILELSAKMLHDGFELKAKSQILEDFFSSFGDLNSSLWQGLTAYKLDSKIGENYKLLHMLNSWGMNRPYYNHYDQYPNLAFLRAKGISKGIKIIYKYPISKKTQKELLEKISMFTRILYEDYIKDFEKRRYDFFCSHCEKNVKSRKFHYENNVFCELCAKKFQIGDNN